MDTKSFGVTSRGSCVFRERLVVRVRAFRKEEVSSGKCPGGISKMMKSLRGRFQQGGGCRVSPGESLGLMSRVSRIISRLGGVVRVASGSRSGSFREW